MARIRILALVIALASFAAGCEESTTIIEPRPEDELDAALRLALDRADVRPVARPQTADPTLFELGRALFFDKILSGNRNISCATCHHPAAATGDALPLPIGEGGRGLAENRVLADGHLIPRNAPHVFNAGVAGVNSMFWDSRLAFDPVTGVFETPEPGLNGNSPSLADVVAPLDGALAAQALFPVTSAEEMRGQPGSNEIADAPDNAAVWAALMERLGTFEEYRSMFLEAFPSTDTFEELSFGHAARAIAAFEREAWTALDSPFDRYLAGDTSALSTSAKRGALHFFGKAGCGGCHDGPLLSDFDHHALAVPQVGPGKNAPGEDLGRALVTGDPTDAYQFRTPALRNVALTGPWMHDGCYTSLEAAVRHHLDCVQGLRSYDVHQLPPSLRETLDTDPARNQSRIDALRPENEVPIALSESEIAELLDFLYALTDPHSLDLSGTVPDRVPSGLPVED